MGNGCTKCCDKVQDCCRDSCGCCPCKCCKTAKVEVKATETIEHTIERKQIPFGYGLIHAGVRTADNTYTSPILEIHTWKKSATQTAMNEASMTQRIALGGIQTERDNADHHLGSLRGAERRRIELEEKVVVIPIESILAINYSNEIKKGETEYKRVRLRTPPPQVQLSCCQEISKCCKTFWCCDNSKVQVHTEPEEIITTISNQEAERKVLITIEYIRYSNIDTPSHIRVLSVPDQFAFFREHLYEDTLKFYLLDNYDLEQADFDLKRTQASTLCRLVTQLKTMVGHYPDEPTLQMIIGKPDNMAIGDPPNETIGRLTGPGMITTSLELTVPVQAIES